MLNKVILGIIMSISIVSISFANNNIHYKCIDCPCTPWGCGCCTVPDGL
jgi:hypothetical protein